MKVHCLSVRPPFSYLLCAGIKDVENRSWASDYRGRLFIHSSGPEDIDGLPDMSDLPLPIYNELYRLLGVEDQKEFEKRVAHSLYWALDAGGQLILNRDSIADGNRAEAEFVEMLMRRDREGLPAMLHGAIIGSVVLTDCVDGYFDSPWRDEEEFGWLISSPQLFEKPITGINGRLRIFDCDIPDGY